MQTNETFSTAEVARKAGVHKDTLLRWLRTGLIAEPKRDRHGWRSFNLQEANAITTFAKASTEDPQTYNVAEPRAIYLGKLKEIDWDFAGAKTSYLTHGIHPYPAKFIPQIPNALIQELSGVGDTVGDIFCGSGTTLVEALTLKRNAVGIDANPLACLISRAKTTFIGKSDAEVLLELVQRARMMSDALSLSGEGELFPTETFTSKGWRPEAKNLEFWFKPFIIEELAECLDWCRKIASNAAQTLALCAFSSIIVTVSNQDSDTRYVRRDKKLAPGEVFKRFSRNLEATLHAAIEYSEFVEPRFDCTIVESSLLKIPQIPQLDLMVCSPPYPNAFSYHLYHMTRMLWLGMDQPLFKSEEIGSHRKYSSKSKNAASPETFKVEFTAIMHWLAAHLKKHGLACFVVGDSTVRGERINNADLIAEAGRQAGFKEVERIDRTMQSTKKSFNPVIGKIKTENILILENGGNG